MKKRAHYSEPTLSGAASGRVLPTLEVLTAYLHACGVHENDLEDWRRRWTALAESTNGTGRSHPTPAPTDPPRPVVPDLIRTPADFAEGLDALRGNRTYQDLNAAAQALPTIGTRPFRLPDSTLSDLLTRGRTSRRTLMVFLRACGIPERNVPGWIAAWERSRHPQLPQQDSDQENESPAQQQHEIAPPPDAKILVAAVDDHPLVLRGLAALLEPSPGISLIATATSVAELLAGPGRQADVVLLDLSLGDGSSPPETIRHLIELGLSVAAYSATADPVTVRAAIRAGAAAFIAKTDQPDDIAEALRRTADGTGWISPPLAFLLLTDDAPDRPALSPQETQALQLYAAGMSMKTVASRMGIAPETAKQYIDRVRKKYRDAGRVSASKIDLLRRAMEDGFVDPPGAANDNT